MTGQEVKLDVDWLFRRAGLFRKQPQDFYT